MTGRNDFDFFGHLAASHPRQHSSDSPNRRSLSAQPDNSSAHHSSSSSPALSSHLHTDSTSELYGPERLFGHHPAPAVYDARRQPAHQIAPPSSSSAVRFDEAQLAMFAADNAARAGAMPGCVLPLKDELALAAGKVTPGVDDTPYIQYAIEALTRNQASPLGNRLPMSGSTDDFYPAGHQQQQQQRQQQQHSPRFSRRLQDGDLARASTTTPPDPVHLEGEGEYRWDSSPDDERRASTPLLQPRTASPNLEPMRIRDKQWIPVTKLMSESIDPLGRTHPPLTYKPRILRPFSMMILMTLCSLMMAALIFTAVYADNHAGLMPYSGTIYSGAYFLFRILPQLLAATILIYAQSIITATIRILPFANMASEDPHRRRRALFQSLYPGTFLLPQTVGPWQVKAFGAAAWLACFTVPLQSSAFITIFVDGEWIWAPTRPVVWALVALYGLMLLATALLMVFWFGHWTGLMWDARSIADVLPMLNRSNVTESFNHGAPVGDDAGHFEDRMRDRQHDRLGYWRTDDMLNGGIWYAIASSAPDEAAFVSTHEFAEKKASSGGGDGGASTRSHDFAGQRNLGGYSYMYLPWCLRTSALATCAAVAGSLLLALLVVAFLPQTRLDAGFLPLLSARPSASDNFSAANFLYSFLPSLLGTALFLAFQGLDLALRRLQPWAELGAFNGSPAHRSILADYAACAAPLQAAWRAASNRHWRVAAVSAVASLGIFIPVLAGGLFMALTTPDGQVRMFPSMPVLGALLALLVLHLGCLFLLMPHRAQLRLPHPVTSVAHLASLCAAKDLTQDAAFRSVRSRRDLESRLGVGARDESVWFLGIVPGRDENRVSVRRMNRFTEKRTRRTMSAESMV